VYYSIQLVLLSSSKVLPHTVLTLINLSNFTIQLNKAERRIQQNYALHLQGCWQKASSNLLSLITPRFFKYTSKSCLVGSR